MKTVRFKLRRDPRYGQQVELDDEGARRAIESGEAEEVQGEEGAEGQRLDPREAAGRHRTADPERRGTPPGKAGKRSR